MSLRVAITAAAASLASTLLLSACGPTATSDSSTVSVVATTNVYGDVAQTIGGDQVTVTAILTSSGQDPHSYEASSRDILTTSKADVVIENGGGYDDFMDQLLDSADGNPTVLNAVGISGYSAPDGGTLNEHVWYDLPTMQRFAVEVATALGDADPAHANLFLQNAKRFRTGLEHLADREADLHQSVAGLDVTLTEPVPGYLLDAVGLIDVTPDEFSEAIEEGGDVPVAVLGDTLNLLTEHEVAALIYNEQTSGAATEEVKQTAEESGVPVVPMMETLPDGKTYLTWMQANLDRLDQALVQP